MFHFVTCNFLQYDIPADQSPEGRTSFEHIIKYFSYEQQEYQSYLPDDITHILERKREL